MKTHVAALIAAVSIAVVLWNHFGRRSDRANLIARIVLVALALGSLAVACSDTLSSFYTTPYGKTDAWGIFHYYLGAKYFDELDYAHFYACAVAADLDRHRVWDADTQVRDLSSYAIVGHDDVVSCPRNRFSPARWNEFAEDVTVLQGIMSNDHRERVLTDKGFNPPPSWAVLSSWVANRVPLDHIAAATFVFNVDLVFALISLLAIAWMVNIETASLGAIFLFLYFGNFGRLTGNFLQYAWLPALTGAVLAWRAARYRQSACWWALSTLAQTFPVALTSVIALRWLRLSLGKARDAEHRGYGRFLGHYAMWLMVGVVVGSSSARGPAAWLEWARKIAAHGRYLVGEVFEIGLRNLIATLASSGVNLADSYSRDYPNVVARLVAFQSYEWLWYVVTLAVVLYVLARSRDLTDEGVLGLGFPMMYVFLVLAPYYYASLTLLFVAFPFNGKGEGLVVHGGLLFLVAYHALQMPVGYITFNRHDHLVSELLIASFMLALLVVTTVRQPLDRAAGAAAARSSRAGASPAHRAPRRGRPHS